MFIIILGVSGRGKTTISQMLAHQLCWPFYESDDYHSLGEIVKMASGIPLYVEDRACWLDT